MSALGCPIHVFVTTIVNLGLIHLSIPRPGIFSLSHPLTGRSSDVLHPNRANVSKDELRSKLSELYKATKEQVSVFGIRTQFGGGKSTGFALIYDSHDAMKRFEPQHRLVRYGYATKVERPSRQQRKSAFSSSSRLLQTVILTPFSQHRQAKEEPAKEDPGYPRSPQAEQGLRCFESIVGLASGFVLFRATIVSFFFLYRFPFFSCCCLFVPFCFLISFSLLVTMMEVVNDCVCVCTKQKYFIFFNGTER